MAQISLWEKICIPTYNDPRDTHHGEVAFDHEKCKGCAMCAKICPANAIVMKEKKPVMVVPQFNYCIACGCCIAICPDDAITLKSLYRYTKYFKTIDRGAPQPPRL
ncbi:MAG: 4Fe-4S binding protein [Deltaproteobacteria bacterium]|nr:4Fe-4S binding protein [Deltaproteobacteria bacterium]